MLLATGQLPTASPLEAVTRESVSVRRCHAPSAEQCHGPTPVRLGFGFLTHSLLPPCRFLTVNGYDGIVVCFGPGDALLPFSGPFSYSQEPRVLQERGGGSGLGICCAGYGRGGQRNARE